MKYVKRSKAEKALVFVEHIEYHLQDMEIDGKVICKICGKTIDEIYEEELIKRIRALKEIFEE